MGEAKMKINEQQPGLIGQRNESVSSKTNKTNIENSYSTFCKALCGIKTVQGLFNLK